MNLLDVPLGVLAVGLVAGFLLLVVCPVCLVLWLVLRTRRPVRYADVTAAADKEPRYHNPPHLTENFTPKWW